MRSVAARGTTVGPASPRQWLGFALLLGILVGLPLLFGFLLVGEACACMT